MLISDMAKRLGSSLRMPTAKRALKNRLLSIRRS
ncbi:unnamed protein product [Strongylus vulgaris]|uniref:Uncharacterized protein n=1 Tax=Strongylus vulgaris TaxID=40348 RepID=A0A3P7IV45_STRVU|nr:unnamed protein product [Strongylus vulgaris]